MRIQLLGVLLSIISCAPANKQLTGLDLPEAAESPELVEPLQLLEAACSSLEPSNRAQAIGPLIYRTRSEEWVKRGLYDPDSWVQRAAGLALLEINEHEELLSYLRSKADPYVRGELAAMLVLQVSESDQATLRELWRAAEHDWERPPLALAAATLGDQPAIDLIGVALEGGDLALNHHFIASLGRSGRSEWIPYLKRGENSAEDELKLPMAAARLALGDPSAQATFVAAFNDPNPEVALEALDHLVPLEAEQVSSLLRRAQSNSDPEIKWYALLALIARHQGSPDKLISALNETNWEVRLWATRFSAALLADGSSNRREHASASRALQRATADESTMVRTEAAKALRWTGSDLADRYLPLLLADTDLSVRLEAAASQFYLPE